MGPVRAAIVLRSAALGLLPSAILCNAQVTITSASVNEFAIGPTSLFDCGLSASVGTDLIISGELSGSVGEPVLTFSAHPRSVPSGSARLGARDLSFTEFSYASGPLGRAVALSHQLPAGRFHWCLRATPVSNDLIGDEFCEDLVVDDLLSMEPLWPLDGDTIDEVRPTISWALSRMPFPPGQTARLVLVPCPGRVPATALAAERPVYVADGVAPPAVPHPFGAPSLVPGSAYAWQVERALDGIVIDRTPPWRFVVRKYTPPPVNKYVRLDAFTPGSVYEVVDRRIYFRYDGTYAGGVLDCSIVDKDGNVKKSASEDDQNGLSTDKRSGVNLYELDLQHYHLSTGYYALRVVDEKKRTFNMTFHVPR